MAQLTVDADIRPENGRPVYVNDPCCGTGRMLLKAAAINPRVELVGQDVDPRCARMTAINLGLRGRYGWVICGNSLTGESSFAYRVAPFFQETPAGLRRGMIRDVPPEATPVPVIAARLREKTAALFAEVAATPAAERPSLPTVIEIPRWLADIEPRLSAIRESAEDRDSVSATPNVSPPVNPLPVDSPATPPLPAPERPFQRRLF